MELPRKQIARLTPGGFRLLSLPPHMKPLFIAEVKTQSPFGFFGNKSWDELFEAANKVGDIISIHTNPLWGGSFDHLMLARRMTNKPILAKGHPQNRCGNIQGY